MREDISLDYFRATPREFFLIHATRRGFAVGSRFIGELAQEPLRAHLCIVYRLLALWLTPRVPETAGTLIEPSYLEGIFFELPALAEVRSSPCAQLMVLVGDLLDPAPSRARLALAAMGVADWALGAGYNATALHYADLAAGLADTARYSYIAGRLNREHGDTRDAEMWLGIALTAASSQHDWNSKIRSHLGLARISFNRGNYPEAQDQMMAALRSAQRHRLPALQLDCHYDLFVLGFHVQDFKMADKHFALALQLFGPDHPRLPHFAHDLALYWLLRRDYRSALAILLPLTDRHFKDEPRNSLLATGTTLRAAGGAGDDAAFNSAAERFDTLRKGASITWPETAQATMQFAHGAAMLGRSAEAGRLVQAAIEAARRTNQARLILDGEHLLDCIARGTVPSEDQPQTKSRINASVREAVLLLT